MNVHKQIEIIERFETAMSDLRQMIDREELDVSNDYPFSCSFDELHGEVIKWSNTLIDKIIAANWTPAMNDVDRYLSENKDRMSEEELINAKRMLFHFKRWLK